MPESGTKPTASAFAASRESVEGVARRIDALGPGTQALIDALVERLDTLPFAAGFDPFAAVPPTPAASRRDPAAARGKPKRRATGTDTTTPPSPSFGALGQAVAGALGSLTGEPAKATSLEAALAGAPFLESTGAADPQPPSKAARRAAGQATPTARAAAPEGGLLAAPAQAAGLVARWLGQWVAEAAAASKPAGAQAAAGGAIGAALAGRSMVPQQILDALAALGPNPPRSRRAAPAAAPEETHAADRGEAIQRRGDPTRTSTPGSPPGNLAPRADSRLLPPATVAQQGPATDKPKAAEADSVADDPIETMTRALIDQAWLRGVDLR